MVTVCTRLLLTWMQSFQSLGTWFLHLEKLDWCSKIGAASSLGMAIFARPVGTRPGPTLMDRVLPSPIRNRVGYGFKKKKPEVGSGFIKKTRDPTRNPARLKTRYPKLQKYPLSLSLSLSLSLYIYIYIYIYNLTLIPYFFSLPPLVWHSPCLSHFSASFLPIISDHSSFSHLSGADKSPSIAMATAKQQQTEGGGGGLNLAHFWVLLAWVLGLDQCLFLGFWTRQRQRLNPAL